MENMNELFKALCSFQLLVTPVKKTKVVKNKNGTEKYRYADFEDVVSHIKPYLHKAGIGFYQDAWTEDGHVYVSTTVFHGESGQSFTSKPFGAVIKDNIGYMTNVQACGTIESYCRRYSLAPALGLSTELDNDGNNYGSDTPEEGKVKIKIQEMYDNVKLNVSKILDPSINSMVLDYIKKNRSIASMSKATEILNREIVIEGLIKDVKNILSVMDDSDDVQAFVSRITLVNSKRVEYVDTDMCVKGFSKLKDEVENYANSKSEMENNG